MQRKVLLKMTGDRSHRMPGNRILSAEEARLLLGIGRNTLYLWCSLGLIPHKRVGGKIDEITGELHGGRISIALWQTLSRQINRLQLPDIYTE